MRVKWTNRAGEVQHRQLQFNSKCLLGKRIDELIIEDWHEARELLSPERREWVVRCVLPAFKIKATDDCL